jgi:hypothetical protein
MLLQQHKVNVAAELLDAIVQILRLLSPMHNLWVTVCVVNAV